MNEKEFIVLELIKDLSVELEPMVPKIFGQPVINLREELFKNEEKIRKWLQINRTLINQL